MTVLDCGGQALDLSGPRVMGVLNVTPDSFSDGGRFIAPERAIAHARELVDEGAAVIDVGGESTRPGAEPVSADDELARVLPVIEALAGELDVPVSVDTSKPEVMRAAADSGAGMINDVLALRAEGALDAAAATGLPICLMHMQGSPRSMQRDPRYDDVVADIADFLGERVDACIAAGIPRERLLIDPGFGFGKTFQHNARLLNRLAELTVLGPPVAVGLSRKSFLGKVTGREVDARVFASVAAAVLAVQAGALLVRAHDVAATVDALRVVAYAAAEGRFEGDGMA